MIINEVICLSRVTFGDALVTAMDLLDMQLISETLKIFINQEIIITITTLDNKLSIPWLQSSCAMSFCRFPPVP